jgi:hypothetical protein
MIIVLAFLSSYLKNFSIISQILIVIFNLVILAISKRETKEDLINSHKNLNEVKIIIH